MGPHVYWYLTRASAIVAFWLLTCSSALGIATSSRLLDRLTERAWVYEIHKFVSLLALGFIGLHIFSLLPDPWTRFGLRDLLVPGTSAYRPLAVALGVIAMYGAVIATGTFYVKRWIGHKTWRALHYTTFATFVLALLHGFFAGTDAHEPWMHLSYISAMLLIFFLVMYRIMAAPLPKERPPSSGLVPKPGRA
jgi:predicted ferric reductase